MKLRKNLIALFAGIIVVLLIFNLFGCGKKEQPFGDANVSVITETEMQIDNSDTNNNPYYDSTLPTTINSTEETSRQQELVYIDIGEPVETNNFSFILKEVGFSDSVCVETDGDRIGLYSENGDTVLPSDGYRWFYYSVDFKLIGTEEIIATNQFVGYVKFGEKYFGSKYRFIKEDGTWSRLSGLENSGNLGLPLPPTKGWDYKYDPWVDKDYELHGSIEVPIKAIDDTQTQMMLNLYLPGITDTDKTEVVCYVINR